MSYGNCKGCDKKYKDLYIKVDEGRVYGENYTAAYPCNTCIDIATRKINKEEFASYVKNVKGKSSDIFKIYGDYLEERLERIAREERIRNRELARDYRLH